MDPARARTIALIKRIGPFDDVERAHRSTALAWAMSDAPLWRVAKPDVPPRHLVSYVALVDAEASALLLVAHRLAGLWLPAGGHVDVGEDPLSAACREAEEELGVAIRMVAGAQPMFVTITETVNVGTDEGHTDVSLWFACEQAPGQAIAFDGSEFDEVRWWSFDEILAADPSLFDPHLGRFVAKLAHRESRNSGGTDGKR